MKAVSLIVKVLILLVFAVLAVINVQSVQFHYLPGQAVEWPLIVVLFGAFLIGALFGLFALFGRLLVLRSENGRLRAEVKKAARLSNTDIAAPAAAPVPAAVPTAGAADKKD
ncbi:lipopolysaccharide assembly LapA domain-containing protein [Neisseria sp. WLZKY-1]|uniref:LapA family protein n=1 Tax=Neisseria sp. WLZKY-1 TaxID=3390377 RepID=UPI00397ACBF4